MAHPLAVTLLASGVLNATGQGASVDLVGADTDRGLPRKLLRVTLRVSAVAGTLPTLVLKVQTSLDGTSGWTDVADGTFSQVAGQEFAVYGLPSAAGFDAQNVRHRLLSATGRCNALIVKQHKLPLVPPYPPELVEASCQIASWRLLEHRGFDPENPADAAVKEAHDDALKWLSNWASGSEQPEVTDDTPDTNEGTVTVDSEPTRGWTAF